MPTQEWCIVLALGSEHFIITDLAVSESSAVSLARETRHCYRPALLREMVVEGLRPVPRETGLRIPGYTK